VGEIYVEETDLVGTAASKCNFTVCKYRLSGGVFIDAGLVAGDMHSSDRAKWEYHYTNGTSFEIWDVNPLP
jgi:hypothetical protein